MHLALQKYHSIRYINLAVLLLKTFQNKCNKCTGSLISLNSQWQPSASVIHEQNLSLATDNPHENKSLITIVF